MYTIVELDHLLFLSHEICGSCKLTSNQAEEGAKILQIKTTRD